MSEAQKAIVDNTAKLEEAEGGLTALETARGKLETAIVKANENKDSVEVDIEAANVYKGKQWVVQEVMGAYETAIGAATTASTAVDKTAADVTDATNALANATNEFNSLKQDGTKED